MLGLSRWHRGKESACQCRRCKRQGLDPWVGKITWSRKWQPTPVVLPKKLHGQRSLVGYSPWDRKELCTTEHANTHVYKMLILMEAGEQEQNFSIFATPQASPAFLAELPRRCQQMATKTPAGRSIRRTHLCGVGR